MKLKSLLLFVILSFFAGAAVAQTMEQEANLKAAFIYNFTKYIDWEANDDASDFIIGVIGPSTTTAALTEVAKTNTVKNRKIVIKIFSKPEDIAYCNILFIPQKSAFPLQSILDKVSKGTLTISEETGFAKRGTAFNFVVMGDKLKFEINLKSLYLAGLKAGSQLLKLGIIVD